MKRIILSLIAVMLVACAYAQDLNKAGKPVANVSRETPAFSWVKTEHDFGKIKQNVPVSYEFAFTNSGDVPLIISTVQASCGCTVTAYSKDPIAPNASGFVKATYNAASIGQFTKTVTVNANTQEGVIKLTIKGEVVAGDVAP